ncbi:glycosyltransferase family 2 protein [Pedobacter cryophilus]|uniref:Glycosyltransferase family 2 protein n=1 Tax=Pedobacter cryophilus TaxID=2571271 RepID=A0A4U1BZH5_9SPHI|nr:glycosyltransferase family 2 protein [Pedobacter cryophilus]TKB98622.1 glycosyltransferase family 2 protein [Pedobacter cryophilus]
MFNYQPLVSICLPVYNAIEFIEETINCFINQTYKNWELIVQDDCSKDGTWELLLEKYEFHDKIRLYQNSQNFGIGKNWNEVYEKVKGEFVVIFNADDLVVNDFLERSVSYFQVHEGIDMVINSYERTDDEKNADLGTIFKSYKGITHNIININHQRFYRIHWNYTLAKKGSLDKLKNEFGLFYPTQVCDAMLWYESYQQNLLAYYSGDIVGTYRVHENNNSKIPLGEFESTLLWMIPIYPEIYKLKIKAKWNSGYILTFKYLYACFKYYKKPNLTALKNITLYV